MICTESFFMQLGIDKSFITILKLCELIRFFMWTQRTDLEEWQAAVVILS